MLGIVIATYNGRHHLEKLLPSLISQSIDASQYTVVVVDNGSTDGTGAFLKKKYPEIVCIPLSKNKGFARANNIGITRLFNNTNIEHVVFLNNDTVVSHNFLEVLHNGASRHKDAASVQTTIVNSNAKDIDSVGIIIDKSFSARNRGYGENNEGQYDKEEEVFGTTGSAMLVRRAALEIAGHALGAYFDPLYFAYNEDVDLALRLRLAGFSAWYVPGGEVRHIHSATGGNQSAFKSFHIHRNTIFNIIKNAPLGMLFNTIVQFVKRYYSLVKNTKKKNTAEYKLSKNIGILAMMWLVVRAWVHVVYYFPQLLYKRNIIQKKKVVSNNYIQKQLTDII